LPPTSGRKTFRPEDFPCGAPFSFLPPPQQPPAAQAGKISLSGPVTPFCNSK
jgi:hypothetical protein